MGSFGTRGAGTVVLGGLVISAMISLTGSLLIALRLLAMPR